MSQQNIEDPNPDHQMARTDSKPEFSSEKGNSLLQELGKICLQMLFNLSDEQIIDIVSNNSNNPGLSSSHHNSNNCYYSDQIKNIENIGLRVMIDAVTRVN